MKLTSLLTIQIPTKQIIRFARIVVHIFLPIALVLGWGGLALIDMTLLGESAEAMGQIAWISFLVTMFLGPIASLLPQVTVLKLELALRRQFGIATSWFAVYHGAAELLQLTAVNVTLQDFTDPSQYLLWGALALIILVLLGLTSNNIATRQLKQWWKRVHYLAYAAIVAGAAHIAIREGEYFGMLALVLVYAGVKVASVTVKKQRRLRAEATRARNRAGSRRK